jgi:hypothetical protein
MKALAIKINTYKASVNIVNNNNLEKKILNIMIAMFGTLAFCYLIFLGNTVFNIVERQYLSKEIQTLSNKVSGLELDYISASNKVDLSLATSLGFKESSIKRYATRKPLGYKTANNILDNIKLAKNEI